MRQSTTLSLAVASSLLISAWAHAQNGDAAGAQGAAPAPAPPAVPAGPLEPPAWLNDDDRIERGKNRFNANCAAYCHGFEGGGGKTPAFRGRKDLEPVAAFKTITAGRVGSDVMPAWGNGFSDEKRWELVAYIMYLTRQPPKPE